MDELQNARMQFTAFHDQVLRKWDHAIKTNDTSELEKDMADSYYVTFFTGLGANPSVFNRSEAIAGMRDSVKTMGEGRKHFKERIVRMRSTLSAVVFTEQVIIKNKKISGTLFNIESWRFMNGDWLLVRETVEHASI